jgi:hypothetical protein
MLNVVNKVHFVHLANRLHDEALFPVYRPVALLVLFLPRTNNREVRKSTPINLRHQLAVRVVIEPSPDRFRERLPR